MRGLIWLMFCVSLVQSLENLKFSDNRPAYYLAEDGTGTVWPQPVSMKTTSDVFSVAVQQFAISPSSDYHTCDLLIETMKRYEKLIYNSMLNQHIRYTSSPIIKTLTVKLASPCEQYPHEDMNEAYFLSVTSTQPTLYSDSIWGVMRGLETFSQLIYETSVEGALVNSTDIVDYPRFAFRGVMIDTARHYLPLGAIFDHLDAMSYNKFNVLHWHIVDDESFPFVSNVFPLLSIKGAFNPQTHVYTQDDIKSVIEYARLRGIRVIPEFDTPGHTRSWGKGHPGLLTPCYSNGQPNGNFGPIDPTVNTTYGFIEQLWREVNALFPEKYIHLGGDEVSFSCWQSNPAISAWMKTHNISGDYSALEQYYIQNVIDISNKVNLSYIVWQEVIDNGVRAKSDTIVDVWKDGSQEELAKVTALGYRALISNPWYLDYISYGSDWERYYKYEPLNFNGTDAQKKLVMGGETCLWAEYVDKSNLMSRMWPRASAIAERLWSPVDVTDVTEASYRLHQQRCRMLNRGINAEPIWKGVCKCDWKY